MERKGKAHHGKRQRAIFSRCFTGRAVFHCQAQLVDDDLIGGEGDLLGAFLALWRPHSHKQL